MLFAFVALFTGGGVHVKLLTSANEILGCDSEALFGTLGLPSSLASLLFRSGATFLEDLLDGANTEASRTVFLLVVVDLLCDLRVVWVVSLSPLP